MRLADRRNVARFEIVGELWASVETVEPLPVSDFGPEGVQVEVGYPLPLGSVHTLRLIRADDETMIAAVVRHLRPLGAASGNHRYAVGFEFLNLNSETRARLDRMIAGSATAPGSDES